jgi:hypothetical protein
MVWPSTGARKTVVGPARSACRDDPWRFVAGVWSRSASAARLVQMRCRECAAEVASTARVSGSIGGFYGNGTGGFHAVPFILDATYDSEGRPIGLVVEDPTTTLAAVAYALPTVAE